MEEREREGDTLLFRLVNRLSAENREIRETHSQTTNSQATLVTIFPYLTEKYSVEREMQALHLKIHYLCHTLIHVCGGGLGEEEGEGQRSRGGIKVRIQVVVSSLRVVGDKVSVVLVHETSGRVLTLVPTDVGMGWGQGEQLHAVGGGVAPAPVITEEGEVTC